MEKKVHKRISYGMEKRYLPYDSYKGEYIENSKAFGCHDCGVQYKELHNSSYNSICDVEECPICHGQLLSCGHASLVFKKPKKPNRPWWMGKPEAEKYRRRGSK